MKIRENGEIEGKRNKKIGKRGEKRKGRKKKD